MTTIIAHRASGRPAPTPLFRRAAVCVRGWMRVRRDRLFLQALLDAMLKDIGLSRSEIDSVARFGLGDASRRVRD